jgi:excisionase family DNA binding protein
MRQHKTVTTHNIYTDPTGPVDRLLSIPATAEMLGGLSPWTVRKWLAEGKIYGVKLGSRRVIPLSEIKRLIDEGTTR